MAQNRCSTLRGIRFDSRRLLTLLAALSVTAASCRPPAEEAPSSPPTCPDGMVLVAGGTFELGEGDDPEHQPNQVNAMIRRGTFEISTFCVDAFPFPGRDGAAWPPDGLDYVQARQLDDALSTHGRRLCTVSELLLAAAGSSNSRYPYGDDRVEGRCDPSDASPQAMGTFAGCVSAAGARDFLVRSAWARLEEPMCTHLGAYGAPNRPPHVGGGVPDVLDYAVYGGIGRTDTFYASTNFGIHGHGADAGQTPDDATRVCRDPGRVDAATEAGYAAWIDGFIAGGSYAALLLE